MGSLRSIKEQDEYISKRISNHNFNIHKSEMETDINILSSDNVNTDY